MCDLTAVIEMQKATIETLRRRVAELEEAKRVMQVYINDLETSNVKLKRQVEALREDAEVGRLVKSVLPISHGDALRIRKVGTTTYVDHIDIDGPTGNVDGHGLSLLEALREAAKGEV